MFRPREKVNGAISSAIGITVLPGPAAKRWILYERGPALPPGPPKSSCLTIRG